MKEELFEEYLKDQIRIRDKELDKFRPFTRAYEMKQEIERLNNIINEFDEWLEEKKEIMEQFELSKRKETGVFWYTTMGEIETFIEKIKELKGVDKE